MSATSGLTDTMMEPQPAPRERLPIIAPLLGLFIVGAVAISPLPEWALVVKLTGVALAFAFAVQSIRTRIAPMAETILYFVWVWWSLSGVFGAKSQLLFWLQISTNAQIWVLLFILSAATVSRKMLSFVLGSLLVGVLIVGVYSYVTGEYAAVERAVHQPGEVRVSGLALNANEFAWYMLLAVAAIAYFWMLPTRTRWLKYGVLAAGMAGATVACVLTGSRTGIAGLVAFFPLWIWFCYRKSMVRRPRVLLAILVGLGLGGYLFWVYFTETGAAERFRTGLTGLLTGTRLGGSYIRVELMKRAWEGMWQHPLTGVGLGNFRFLTRTGHVAHSEYAKVVCDTGIPGFLIYFAIFVVLWRRAGKIAKHADDPVAVNIARLTRAILVIVMLTNLGRYNSFDKAAWIVFGSLIGYTSSVWRGLRYRGVLQSQAQPATAPMAAGGSMDSLTPAVRDGGPAG